MWCGDGVLGEEAQECQRSLDARVNRSRWAPTRRTDRETLVPSLRCRLHVWVALHFTIDDTGVAAIHPVCVVSRVEERERM